MSAVVIDASAGAKIVADTRPGRALTRLVPAGAEGWVPEHFYAEVLELRMKDAWSRRARGLGAGLTGGQGGSVVA